MAATAPPFASTTLLTLGVDEHSRYEDGIVRLERGQMVVLYTDGITEARGPAGAMFGIEGIESAVTECSGEPACIVESIITSLKTYQAGQRPVDDRTIVALQVED